VGGKMTIVLCLLNVHYEFLIDVFVHEMVEGGSCVVGCCVQIQ